MLRKSWRKWYTYTRKCIKIIRGRRRQGQGEITMKVSSIKDKGRRLQKWVANKIGQAIGLPVGKDLPIQSREMGQSGADIRLDSQAKRFFPFSVECKNTAKWNMTKAIQQAKENTAPGQHWLVVFKRESRRPDERIPPVVILDAEVFFDLFKRVHDTRIIELEELRGR